MLSLIILSIFIVNTSAWLPNKLVVNTLLSTSLLVGNVENTIQDHNPEPVSPMGHIHTFKPPINGEESMGSSVSVSRNNIYFRGVVTTETCAYLKNTLEEMDYNGRLFRINYHTEPPPINLHIQSMGGSLMDSFYIVDTIKNSETPVHTYIDGYAASAASLMSVVGQHRVMTENSMILIHQLSSGNEGKFQEMDDNMRNMEQLMHKIKVIYGESTSIPEEELDEILKHDLWLDAETCKRYGLIDEII